MFGIINMEPAIRHHVITNNTVGPISRRERRGCIFVKMKTETEAAMKRQLPIAKL